MTGADILGKRRRHKVLQADLARAVGINMNTLTDVENERLPPLEAIDQTLDRLIEERKTAQSGPITNGFKTA